MSTDFFQRQADAQRGTFWLICMFCLSALAIVGIVMAIAAAVVQTQMREPNSSISAHPEQVVVPMIAGAVALLIILGGTAYKVLELKTGGGSRVAESLGGRRIYPNTTDQVERRLLNVVEEMALASGTPVPPVFLLNEAGINAFAAGYTPSDAVLGVTRGCAEQLSRDELQGVIAHEFSHVLNGDMRMSIRLIGILHGILLIGLTGQLILRTFFYSGSGRSRNNDKNGGGQIIIVIMAVGLAALILGFVGTFFGSLIKAAVSRQREYLADASAVQFTRNPLGIANALKRIGGFSAGSKLKAAAASEASHMYFAQGVWEGLFHLSATHPPLAKRIRALDPRWDGKFLASRTASDAQGADLGLADVQGLSPLAGEVPLAVVDHAVDYVGEPNTGHRDYAIELLERLPAELLVAAREPYSARALVYALLLDQRPQFRSLQIEALQAYSTPDVLNLACKLRPAIDAIDIRARLPLVELAVPALKAMSRSQYQMFKQCFTHLVRADQHIDLFEWMLSQLVVRHVQPQFEKIRSTPTRYRNLLPLSNQCAKLLSAVAAAGNGHSQAVEAFQRGTAHLPELSLQQLDSPRAALDELSQTLHTLTLVSAKHRLRVVDACAAAICADQHVTWQEAELLRGISDLLDCPMPPLLVKGQPPA